MGKEQFKVGEIRMVCNEDVEDRGRKTDRY